MPIDSPREDVVEDLFWSVCMERGQRSEELMADDAQSPLNRRVSAVLITAV
jgi:hypothetical protein